MGLELAETAKSFPISIKEGLMGYWRMEEASWDGTPGEVIDSSGQDNHGQMKGGGTLDSATGKLGQGFNANGINWFEFPPSVVPQLAGSLFSWVKSNSSIDDLDARFFGTDDTAGQTKEHRTYRNGVDFPLELAFRMEAGPIVARSLPATFTNDTWVFVGWTWLYDSEANETAITGYLNNVAGPPFVSAGKIVASDRSFNIAEWGGTVLPSPAGIDETTIHSRVLSADDRTALYNSGAAVLLPLSGSFALPLEVADIRPELEVVEV